MPCHVMDLLACWLYRCSRPKPIVFWNMILHCLMWGIWQERNAHTFVGSEINSFYEAAFPLDVARVDKFFKCFYF